MVKFFLPVLLPYLLHLINTSLSSGVFPSPLKRSLVTPIPKKNGVTENDLSGYRPVASLQFISKLLERTAASRLTDYLESTGAFADHQSAYRKWHSVESSLIKMTSDIAAALDGGEHVLFVATDITAAFDTVNHKRILLNLEQMGIASTALNWISSYLENRNQVVTVNKYVSQPKKLRCGVPQGSVMGPLLFNTYMAPLSKLLQKLPVHHHLYADDVFVYVSFSTSTVVEKADILNKALKVISDWMLENYLCLNPGKTHCQLFSNKRSTIPDIPDIYLRETSIKVHREGSFRLLGVQLDCNLGMDDFVSATCRSAFHQIRMIAYIRKSINRDAAKLLSHSLVLSRVDFCLSLLSASPHRATSRLQRVINHAARVVMKIKRSDHITPILKELNWLDFSKRMRKKKVIFTFNAIAGKSPIYLREMLVPYVPGRALRSQNCNLLTPHHTKKKIGMLNFRHWGPHTWNEIDVDVRGKTSMGGILASLDLA
jgi:hypothetical protein